MIILICIKFVNFQKKGFIKGRLPQTNNKNILLKIGTHTRRHDDYVHKKMSHNQNIVSELVGSFIITNH